MLQTSLILVFCIACLGNYIEGLGLCPEVFDTVLGVLGVLQYLSVST